MDEEKNVKISTAPARIFEVLGFKSGQKFNIIREGISYGPYHYNAENEKIEFEDGNTILSAYLQYAINHPESVCVEVSLTEKEKSVCDTLGAKYITKDSYGLSTRVSLWKGKPDYRGGTYRANGENNLGAIAMIDVMQSKLFEWVKGGDCIFIDE